VQTAPDPAKWGELALSLLPFMPTVDGEVLARPPLEALADGAGSDVALLTGSNAEEARLFLVAPGMIGLIDEPTAIGGASAYGLDGAAALEAYANAGSAHGDVLAAVVTDWFFTVPAIRVAEARASAGRTWMYRCDYRSTAGEGLLGAAHATEIPYVFDTHDTPDATALLGPDAPQSVADAMHSAWVRFVTDIDPGWAPYDPSTRSTQVFRADGSMTEDHPNAERLALWDGVR
jgi:para-nitrobenzyl esterase